MAKFADHDEALIYVAQRLGITLVDDGGAPSDCVSGPVGASLSFSQRAVVALDGEGICCASEDVLHEMCHIVLGPPSVDPTNCETWLLMQYEWALARFVARWFADPTHGLAFMDRVQRYQDGTTAGGWDLETWGPGVRRSRWWKRRVTLLIEGGLLTRRGTPTWRSWRPSESDWYYRDACDPPDPPEPPRTPWKSIIARMVVG